MGNIIRTDTIHAYNQWAGVETQYPLVSFIDFSKVAPLRHARKLYGFYAVFLKDQNCGELRYGRQYYDYQDGTLIFVAPGQAFGAEDDGEVFQPTSYILMFHPDLLLNTPLARMMKDYTYFSYETNEALHISEQERRIVMDCFAKIQYELQYPVDNFSKTLITDTIKTFLDYCSRFYSRQFITRYNVNRDILTRFEKLLDDYFHSDKPMTLGLPNVQYCADKLHLSPNYLSDLLRKEAGNTALDFQYPQHFTRLFKREVGCTPNEYRVQFN